MASFVHAVAPSNRTARLRLRLEQTRPTGTLHARSPFHSLREVTTMRRGASVQAVQMSVGCSTHKTHTMVPAYRPTPPRALLSRHHITQQLTNCLSCSCCMFVPPPTSGTPLHFEFSLGAPVSCAQSRQHVSAEILPSWSEIDTLPTCCDLCRSTAASGCRKLRYGTANTLNEGHARTTTYQLSPTLCAAPPHSRSSVRMSALSAMQEEALLLEHEKTFTYGKEFAMTVKVTEAVNGDQTVFIETDYPSANLILHWGVQGGRSWTGGWRLPDHRPKDTIEYKDRALQTSFKCALTPSTPLASAI